MKICKCVGCGNEFDMDDSFFGQILCENCDPQMDGGLNGIGSKDKIQNRIDARDNMNSFLYDFIPLSYWHEPAFKYSYKERLDAINNADVEARK